LQPDAKINLNGCHTANSADGSVAQNVSRALPGITVGGGDTYQVNIPFSSQTIGKKSNFKLGGVIND
jgi:hypothetical protein